MPGSLRYFRKKKIAAPPQVSFMDRAFRYGGPAYYAAGAGTIAYPNTVTGVGGAAVGVGMFQQYTTKIPKNGLWYYFESTVAWNGNTGGLAFVAQYQSDIDNNMYRAELTGYAKMAIRWNASIGWERLTEMNPYGGSWSNNWFSSGIVNFWVGVYAANGQSNRLLAKASEWMYTPRPNVSYNAIIPG